MKGGIGRERRNKKEEGRDGRRKGRYRPGEGRDRRREVRDKMPGGRVRREDRKIGGWREARREG
jgi:hypothetical protein